MHLDRLQNNHDRILYTTAYQHHSAGTMFHNIAYSLCLVALCSVAYWVQLKRLSRTLPPGPLGLPIIGNIHQLRGRYPWKQFQKWHRIYGPIFTIQIGQMKMIILGSHAVANDILTKRSVTYSSRPRLIVAQESFAKGFGAAVLPYGPKWKQNHGMQISLLNPRRSQLYCPLQELESGQLLYNLLSADHYEKEFHRYSASLIFALLYGKRFPTCGAEELQQIELLAEQIVKAVSFGNWIVDIFPVLNWMPRCFAKWKQLGDDFHQRQSHLYAANSSMATKSSTWNWTRHTFTTQGMNISRKDIDFALGELFEAGSHTTTGAIIVAMLACISYPDSMHKVRAEIDQNTTGGRIPSIEDVEALPFLQAFVKEVLRWKPLAPGGVPHSALNDDTYNGFHIPKGAAVVANHWSLDMDDAVFDDPEIFRPERWIEHDKLPLAAFGFGRRTCPGRHVAYNSILLVLARIIWAYDITCDESQRNKLEHLDMTHEGIFSKPGVFQMKISVRSQEHREMIEAAQRDSSGQFERIMTAIGEKFDRL